MPVRKSASGKSSPSKATTANSKAKRNAPPKAEAKKATPKGTNGSAGTGKTGLRKPAVALDENVIINLPVTARTRAGLTKLKSALDVASQGKVIDALVSDELRRRRLRVS